MRKPIFDCIDRNIIITYYRNPGYWRKNIIVQQYEQVKSKRDIDRIIKELAKRIERSVLWKYIDKIARDLEKPSKIN